MVVLGVVLVLLALAVGILLVAGVASLEGTVDVSVPGGTLSFPPLTFLVTGMIVISVFWLGWVVLRHGARRSRRRRAEAKEAARAAEERRAAEEQRMKDEFAARERQLIEERRRHDSETAELRREATGGHGDVHDGDPTPTGRPSSPTDGAEGTTTIAETPSTSAEQEPTGAEAPRHGEGRDPA